MGFRQTGRILIGYYSLLSLLVLFNGVIIPIRDLVYAFRDSLVNSIPVTIIPSGVVVCLLLLVIQGLRQNLTWGYYLSVAIQCLAMLFSLVVLAINFVFGSAFALLNGLVLLVILRESVMNEANVLTSPSISGPRKSLLTRVIGIVLVFLCLSLMGWCVASEYTAQKMSGYGAMLRLAGETNGAVSRDEIRLSLLEKVPLGTTKEEVASFLETNGVPEDRFVGGQFVRYQSSYREILALFSTPPWVLTFICSQDHNAVRFIFDESDALEDIVIENYSVCL